MKKALPYLLLALTLGLGLTACNEEYDGPTKAVHLRINPTNFNPDSVKASGELLLSGRLRFVVVGLQDEPLSSLEEGPISMPYDLYRPLWRGSAKDRILVRSQEFIVGEQTDTVYLQMELRDDIITP